MAYPVEDGDIFKSAQFGLIQIVKEAKEYRRSTPLHKEVHYFIKYLDRDYHAPGINCVMNHDYLVNNCIRLSEDEVCLELLSR